MVHLCETPTANDQPSEEVNIPSEDGFDDLDTDVHNDHPVPLLPKKGLDQHQDIDDHGSDTMPDLNPPVAPPAPPAIQQGGENVRRSGRRREVPVRPGNVYGEKRTPTEIARDVEQQTYWKKTVGESSRSRIPTTSRQQQVPGPSSQPPITQSDAAAPLDDEQVLVLKLAQEGGVRFMNFLLAKAVPPHNELPNTSDIRKWTFRDILRMPTAQQKEWKHACREELESLQKRKVYELCELPPGRKAIKN